VKASLHSKTLFEQIRHIKPGLWWCNHHLGTVINTPVTAAQNRSCPHVQHHPPPPTGCTGLYRYGKVSHSCNVVQSKWDGSANQPCNIALPERGVNSVCKRTARYFPMHTMVINYGSSNYHIYECTNHLHAKYAWIWCLPRYSVRRQVLNKSHIMTDKNTWHMTNVHYCS
jgi:hypothetical protein